MQPIKTTTVFVPVDEDNPNIIGDFISNDGQSMCRLEKKENMVVMTVEQATMLLKHAIRFGYDISKNNYGRDGIEKETEYIKSLLP